MDGSNRVVLLAKIILDQVLQNICIYLNYYVFNIVTIREGVGYVFIDLMHEKQTFKP